MLFWTFERLVRMASFELTLLFLDAPVTVVDAMFERLTYDLAPARLAVSVLRYLIEAAALGE